MLSLLQTSPIDHQTSIGGEDRNRTYLGPASAGSTTVLKTARATRHPSLSGRKKTTSNAQLKRIRSKSARKGASHIYLAFLIALTMASKSGQSPDSSLE